MQSCSTTTCWIKENRMTLPYFGLRSGIGKPNHIGFRRHGQVARLSCNVSLLGVRGLLLRLTGFQLFGLEKRAVCYILLIMLRLWRYFKGRPFKNPLQTPHLKLQTPYLQLQMPRICFRDHLWLVCAGTNEPQMNPGVTGVSTVAHDARWFPISFRTVGAAEPHLENRINHADPSICGV